MSGSTIFGTLPVGGVSTWKPVTSGNGVGSGGGLSSVFQAKQSQGASGGDSVSVSKLGQALSGVAAEAFAHLDDKAKGFLNNLVESGAISAEKVALGLRSMATQAAYSRYGAEHQADAEENETRDRFDKAMTNSLRYGDKIMAAHEKYANSRREIMDESGIPDVITTEETEDPRLNPLGDAFRDELAAIDAEYPAHEREIDHQALTASMERVISQTMNGFKSAMADQTGGDGFLELFDAEGRAAADELLNLGFASVASDAMFKDFADTVDLPGFGRKADPLIQGAAQTGETATAAAGIPAEAAASASASFTAAASSTTTATSATSSAADPGNGQAAISLLQGALDSQAKTAGATKGAQTGGATDPDAGLASLLDALKNGTANPGSFPSSFKVEA